jgi:hypothetical protein
MPRLAAARPEAMLTDAEIAVSSHARGSSVYFFIVSLIVAFSLDVDGMRILKWTLKNFYKSVAWIQLSQST